jgi:hypothetical protein
MTGISQNRTLAQVAGAAGIVAQLAAAYFFVLYPALVVPPPATYLFVVAWLTLVVLAIAWWRHHPWRSFLVPVVAVPIVWLLLQIGVRFLGWAP